MPPPPAAHLSRTESPGTDGGVLGDGRKGPVHDKHRMPRLHEGVAPGSERGEMKGFLSNASPPDGREPAPAPRNTENGWGERKVVGRGGGWPEGEGGGRSSINGPLSLSFLSPVPQVPRASG